MNAKTLAAACAAALLVLLGSAGMAFGQSGSDPGGPSQPPSSFEYQPEVAGPESSTEQPAVECTALAAEFPDLADAELLCEQYAAQGMTESEIREELLATQESHQPLPDSDPSEPPGSDPGSQPPSEPSSPPVGPPSSGPEHSTQPPAPLGTTEHYFYWYPIFLRGDVDCRDFASQSDAQSLLAVYPADPFILDRDGDGVACEDEHPAVVTVAQTSPYPVGGVATGRGGTAEDDMPGVLAVVATLGVTGGAGAMLARRRIFTRGR